VWLFLEVINEKQGGGWMTHGSLFSGIGGFDLAARWAGIKNKWQVEWDKYCQKVLKKNFPDVKRYWDITKIKEGELESVDIISGGFPCQPFSQAGKREGKEDDRYLWPEMLRVIRLVGPKYVIGENVAGIINMELDQVLSDLEAEGYTTETFIIPACGVGAPHRRDRVWILAYSYSPRRSRGTTVETNRCGGNIGRKKTKILQENVANTNNTTIARQRENDGKIHREPEPKGLNDGCQGWWSVEPDVGRVANGIPNRVDRLKSLGNAIVPQIAYVLFEVIKKMEEINK
jgi:DNA (cytosine-5)-methyltransferase 1